MRTRGVEGSRGSWAMLAAGALVWCAPAIATAQAGDEWVDAHSCTEVRIGGAKRLRSLDLELLYTVASKCDGPVTTWADFAWKCKVPGAEPEHKRDGSRLGCTVWPGKIEECSVTTLCAFETIDGHIDGVTTKQRPKAQTNDPKAKDRSASEQAQRRQDAQRRAKEALDAERSRSGELRRLLAALPPKDRQKALAERSKAIAETAAQIAAELARLRAEEQRRAQDQATAKQRAAAKGAGSKTPAAGSASSGPLVGTYQATHDYRYGRAEVPTTEFVIRSVSLEREASGTYLLRAVSQSRSYQGEVFHPGGECVTAFTAADLERATCGAPGQGEPHFCNISAAQGATYFRVSRRDVRSAGCIRPDEEQRFREDAIFLVPRLERFGTSNFYQDDYFDARHPFAQGKTVAYILHQRLSFFLEQR